MQKKILILLSLAAILSLIFVVPSIQAQNFNSIDINTVNVSELSDEQIRQADREIRDRGLTLQQFEQLAVAQGASRLQVTQLIQRIRSLRTSSGTDTTENGGEARSEMIPIAESDTYREQVNRPQVQTQRNDSLKVFGMDLFDQISVSFEPSLNVPTPVDYVLGAGDELVIDIWGAAEQTYRLTVSPEGTIRIPNLSPIQVNGLQMNDAERRILNRLTDIYSGLRPNNPDQGNTFAQVTLGNVRSIKVTVIGEVTRPGTYTVSSLATAFNALYAAGGPARNGTFRAIQIIRGREIVETLDLYDFLVTGNQESNIRLRDQDVIKVDPYANRVHVWGETKRKGFFETLEGETLADLLSFAAGFSDEAYTRTLTLEGMTPEMRRVTTVRYPEESGIEIRNGDKLRVGKIMDRFTNRVEILGAVYRPGTYEYTDGMTLYDLITQADGPLEEAFMNRAVIERVKENREPEILSFSVQRLLEDPAGYDIPLRPDDVVRISNIFDLQEEFTIRVRGAVLNDTTFIYSENITLEDAILKANGFRDNAATYRIEVARRVTDDTVEMNRMNRIAEVLRFEVDQNLGFSDEDAAFELMPFDQVYVRTRPNYEVQQTVRVEGEVEFPGVYVLPSRTTRLSDIIEQAGGLSDYAFPRGASLDRRLNSVAAEELAFLDEEERNFLQDEDRTSVGIRLAEALRRPGSNIDLILEDGDVITVPKELQTVRIEGEVLSPTSVQFQRGKSFQSYINSAGGITDNAQRKRAYIVYANGEVDRTRRFLFFRSNPDVQPGATIVIPREPDTRELTAQERISIAATVASTAATLALIVERLSR
jgi:protein involved in polysaccharide export with SLBB domain